jgi:hypothetical protein
MQYWTFTIKLISLIFWFLTFSPAERVALSAAFLVFIGVVGEYVIEIKAIEANEGLYNRIKKLAMALLLLGLAGDVLGIVMGQAEMAELTRETGDAATLAQTARGDAKNAISDSLTAQIKADSAGIAASGANVKAESVAIRAKQIDTELATAEYLMSARQVQNRDVLAAKIKEIFHGKNVVLKSYIGDQEGWGLCTQLWHVAKDAEMNPIDQCGRAQLEVPLTSPFGISGPDVGETLKLGQLINDIGRIGGWSGIKSPALTIFVGAKSSFVIGQVRGTRMPQKQTKKKIKNP